MWGWGSGLGHRAGPKLSSSEGKSGETSKPERKFGVGVIRVQWEMLMNFMSHPEADLP